MPQQGLVQQQIKSFLGVNLRKDRVDLADEELAKSVNADLHTSPGTIVLRKGRTKQFSTALSDLVIRRLGKVNAKRYQVAGTTVYRDQTSILTGLSSNLITTLLPFRPLNDTTLWVFIADDSLMRKDDGTSTRIWGIAAPTATPVASVTVGGGSLSAGAYLVKFTYVRKSGTSIAHESNPSPASSSVTAAANDRLSITGMTASSDAQVTHKRIYRTQAGGTSYLFDSEIADATTTATLSKADSALGSALETDNDVPPMASWAVAYQEHVFFCRDASNKHYLWYSKRFRPESVPAANFLEIGNPDDPLQCGVSTAGMLGVFSRQTKYRVLGNSVTGFVAQEGLSRRGTPAPNAAIGTEYGAIFVARDGVYLTNFAAPDTGFSWEILPLFFGETINGMDPINWTYAERMAAATYKNKYYLAYPSGSNTNPDKIAVYSHDTKKWYFFDHPMRSLFVEEDADDLVGGSTDGFVYILEDGSSDAGSGIALDCDTKDYFGESTDLRKLFRYFKVDTDADGDNLTANFYVDGTLKRTATISGNRTKVLNQLPEDAWGYQWRINFTYTGTKRPRIYGVSGVWLPMGGA